MLHILNRLFKINLLCLGLFASLLIDAALAQAIQPSPLKQATPPDILLDPNIEPQNELPELWRQRREERYREEQQREQAEYERDLEQRREDLWEQQQQEWEDYQDEQWDRIEQELDEWEDERNDRFSDRGITTFHPLSSVLF